MRYFVTWVGATIIAGLSIGLLDEKYWRPFKQIPLNSMSGGQLATFFMSYVALFAIMIAYLVINVYVWIRGFQAINRYSDEHGGCYGSEY